jgi:hypothetical protein
MQETFCIPELNRIGSLRTEKKKAERKSRKNLNPSLYCKKKADLLWWAKRRKKRAYHESRTRSTGVASKPTRFYSAFVGICAIRSVTEIWRKSCKKVVCLWSTQRFTVGFSEMPRVGEAGSSPPYGDHRFLAN